MTDVSRETAVPDERDTGGTLGQDDDDRHHVLERRHRRASRRRADKALERYRKGNSK